MLALLAKCGLQDEGLFGEVWIQMTKEIKTKEFLAKCPVCKELTPMSEIIHFGVCIQCEDERSEAEREEFEGAGFEYGGKIE